MSKRILKNTPSQSRERPPIVATPTSCHRLLYRQTNSAATITHHHTTKSSTSDYTCCKRIIGKTTHHNLPHYNIVGKSHDHSLPPYNIAGKDTHGNSPLYNIGRKDTHGNSPSYNIDGKGHAPIFLLNIIAGEGNFHDNERWLSRARVIFAITRGSYRERGYFSR